MTPLTEFGPGIWVGEGPVVQFFRFPYPTRMVVMRLADGGLFVWSPIALKPELKAAVDGLGPVRFLVSPNLLHHLFLGEWKTAYPHARLYASPGLAQEAPRTSPSMPTSPMRPIRPGPPTSIRSWSRAVRG